MENNPDLADELMTFFDQAEDVTLIDILPAMTGEDFVYLLSKVDESCSGWEWIVLMPSIILR